MPCTQMLSKTIVNVNFFAAGVFIVEVRRRVGVVILMTAGTVNQHSQYQHPLNPNS